MRDFQWFFKHCFQGWSSQKKPKVLSQQFLVYYKKGQAKAITTVDHHRLIQDTTTIPLENPMEVFSHIFM